MPTPLLVIVHIGSALGSATMNLGKMDADAGRDALQLAFEQWTGGVVAIHGELSDELPRYAALQKSLYDLMKRAEEAGHISASMYGDDSVGINQNEAITQWLDQANLDRETPIHVTGAWFHSTDGEGCVGGVRNTLIQLGWQAEIHDSALDFDDPEWFCNREEEDETPEQEEREPEASSPAPVGRPRRHGF